MSKCLLNSTLSGDVSVQQIVAHRDEQHLVRLQKPIKLLLKVFKHSAEVFRNSVRRKAVHIHKARADGFEVAVYNCMVLRVEDDHTKVQKLSKIELRRFLGLGLYNGVVLVHGVASFVSRSRMDTLSKFGLNLYSFVI